MTKRPNYLEYKRNTLLRDYRNAKSNDKVKILVEIMDLEEELKYSNNRTAKRIAL
ncbi:hypothetical protein [Desulfitibacter alkalitolerans]|uniref:hypothetical protein n=1 Tax=Desulfitibacter alkalitolerans TaxID=264641 RepID=UPI0012EC0ABC|nr:hypothetical protein [Desulfitibacter alkalitolerans]